VFHERQLLSGRELKDRLQACVLEAARIIEQLDGQDLDNERWIQGFRVTGFQAIAHVTEHFAYHCGQIVSITKLRLDKDLRFTKLPGEEEGSTDLPVI
jgi:hypothetical protein